MRFVEQDIYGFHRRYNMKMDPDRCIQFIAFRIYHGTNVVERISNNARQVSFPWAFLSLFIATGIL